MTAVEFTIEKYEKFINSENGSGERYFYDELVKDIEQAKAMEKEQIFDAWNNALINTHIASNSIGVPYDKEKYYNETYNKSSV
jgi:hypothetical protein